MPSLRDMIAGPWRAVSVLGITQIIAWGTIFYSPVLTAPLIVAETGWSLSFAMGGFSLGLLIAGLVSPFVGRSIDRYGGHVVMTVGSLVSALGLARPRLCPRSGDLPRGLDGARRGPRRLALRSGLRDARAHLRRRGAPPDHGADARRRLCLDRGLAGDASADRRGRLARHLHRLCRADGGVCAPLYAFALPRSRASVDAAAGGHAARPPALLPAAWHGLRAGDGGVHRLCLRAVGAVGASARDLRPHRHRCRDRGVHRHAVRPGAGRGAADRVRLRPQRASAAGRRAPRWRCWCSPSRCWRCSAFRCRSRRPSR